MDITEEKVGDVTTLGLRGRLDAMTWKPTEERLLKLIDAGERKLVLDLSELTYISSVGLRVLMVLAKRLKSVGGSPAVLCAMQPPVAEVFEIAGFGSIFRIVPTRAEAIGSL